MLSRKITLEDEYGLHQPYIILKACSERRHYSFMHTGPFTEEDSPWVYKPRNYCSPSPLSCQNWMICRGSALFFCSCIEQGSIESVRCPRGLLLRNTTVSALLSVRAPKIWVWYWKLVCVLGTVHHICGKYLVIVARNRIEGNYTCPLARWASSELTTDDRKPKYSSVLQV